MLGTDSGRKVLLLVSQQGRTTRSAKVRPGTRVRRLDNPSVGSGDSKTRVSRVAAV